MSEFWLSATGTPRFVVRRWPLLSTRTRSSDPTVGLAPSAAREPTLSEVLVSASVLAVAKADGGMTCVPSGGSIAPARPCSAALFSLKGISAAVASTSAACSAAMSGDPKAGAREAALSELRAAEAPATSFLDFGVGLREVAMSAFPDDAT
ncbi:hypothetical protein [Pseudoxanthomonas mexicana]|uniref:hypothetical protein n=1 Tax=Pseudoxanthomonas mexicana TaxID=128785 RepID=UPI001E510E6F|nr:hypothetical protein [Pseudoxanthomonas mexicana]